MSAVVNRRLTEREIKDRIAERISGLEVSELEADSGLRQWREANRPRSEDPDFGWEATEPASLELLP